MSNLDKLDASEKFYNEYKLLTETKKNTFSHLVNKLLKDNFIYAQLDTDKSDYYSLINYREIIESYLSIIDYNLLHDDNNKVFFIETKEDRNRIRLKKIDTVVLLVLRLMYYKGQRSINSLSNASNVNIISSELVENINNTNIFSNETYKSELLNSLKLLRRYKIIGFDFKKFEDDSVISIYPTILQVVRNDNINSLNDLINSYISERGEVQDEVSED